VGGGGGGGGWCFFFFFGGGGGWGGGGGVGGGWGLGFGFGGPPTRVYFSLYFGILSLDSFYEARRASHHLIGEGIWTPRFGPLSFLRVGFPFLWR